MITRSAAGVLALALIGALAVASVRTNSASEEIAAASTGIDIPALAAVADTPQLPLLSIHDPI